MKYKIIINKINNRLKFISFVKNYFRLSFTEAKEFADQKQCILPPKNWSEDDWLTNFQYDEIKYDIKNIAEYSFLKSEDKKLNDFSFIRKDFTEKYDAALQWYNSLSEQHKEYFNFLSYYL